MLRLCQRKVSLSGGRHAGNIWFTGQHGHYIGKLDPKGNLFFTTSGNNFVGRVDGRTGEVTMVRQDSSPYGILVNSKGVPFFTLFGTNKLGSIDPDTMEIREYVLPTRTFVPGASPLPPTM